MGRWHRLIVVLATALGLSGCLLFADPINKAPTVTVVTPDGPFYPNKPIAFWAIPKDDKDDPSVLHLHWNVFDAKSDSCLGIGASDWQGMAGTSSPIDQPYSYTPKTLARQCVCAQVTDSKGANGYGCSSPIKLTPTIIDPSGAKSGDARPLCAAIRLTTDAPKGDTIQYKWGLSYSGSSSAGKSVQLSPCDSDKSGSEQCLSAAAPGTYTVSLTVTDSADASHPGVASDYVVSVGVDQPPCLGRTDPDVRAQRILLSRSPDLSGSYQSRTLKAMSVEDDCEPYPPVAGSKGSAQFVWSVSDPTSSTGSAWVRQTEATNAFVVSQTRFPNARPGDIVKVRLEVRDQAVQSMYAGGGTVCPDATEICCGPGECKGTNDCVRWTTWSVQFQP